MTDAAITVLAIVGFAVAALESVVLTLLAWLLSFSAAKVLGHERRIAAMEASLLALRSDVDEVDLIVDRTLDVAGVSRNGVLRQAKDEVK